MNIKILDSWLKDFLKTDAKPKEIADILSLTSVSVDKLEKVGSDYLYDVEMMTNRMDLASISGLAREAAAILNHAGHKTEYIPPDYSSSERSELRSLASNSSRQARTVKLDIKNDPKLVNRICAVVMEVTIKPSPKKIKERLEATDIRSLNNVIDITNYVMRTIGHPTHVFDFDRIGTGKIIIRESKKGEEITTLDGKKYTLPGGDLVADDGTGRIIDLLGIMGLENSVVTKDTKRILFFIDNNETSHMRKTSMTLGIRTEAAQMNEKGIDSELAYDALLYGIKLYEEIAEGKVVSEILDIYPNKPKVKHISLSEEKMQNVIGVPISLKTAKEILVDLGFGVEIDNDHLTVSVPSYRVHEMDLPEDVIEEVARVYGYHNIPSLLPPSTGTQPYHREKNEFYWENRIKDMMKYYGFTELYTYSMVSKDLYEGDVEQAVMIQNPLNEDGVYMRTTLIISLLQVLKENKRRQIVEIFEIANIYEKNGNALPKEKRMFSGVSKKPHNSFFHVKGLLENLFIDLGITSYSFSTVAGDSAEVTVMIKGTQIGEISILDPETITFEVSVEDLLRHVSLKKVYAPLPKYPEAVEDLAIIASETVTVGEISTLLKKQSSLIKDVSLLDKYKDIRTFHIVYQHKERNLTGDDLKPIREKIIMVLKKEVNAKVKE